MDFLAALKAEMDKLQAELEADPRYAKLEELRRVSRLYTDGPQQQTPGERVLARAYAASVQAKRSASPARKAALEGAKQFLNNKLFPTKTAEILPIWKRWESR